MRSRLIVPGLMVLTTTFGCFGAATTGQDDEGAPPPAKTEETGSVSSAILASCNDDSVPGPAPIGECDGGCTTVRPSCATVTLDGKACPVLRGVGTGLDMGLDGNGWTVDATSDACGIILEVSGLDDQSYPQSSPTAVLGESRIMLFTGEAVDGGVSGAYSSNAPSASVVVESGPVHGSARAIKGHAHVIRADGKAHDVTYSLVF